MTRCGKKITAVILILMLSLTSTLPCSAAHKDYTNADLQKNMEKIIHFKKQEQGIKYDDLFSSDFLKSAGSTSADWYALAIGRIGFDDDYGDYLSALKINFLEEISKNGKESIKATDWQRIALTVLSLGEDPTSFLEGINIVNEGIYNFENLKKQGANAYIWALITLDSLGYPADKDNPDIREKLIAEILNFQCENGGFTLDGKNPDVDITAMALQSLSSYYDKYTSEIDSALQWLSENQNDDGNFSAWGNDNLESTAQVIVALCSLGIYPDSDNEFTKNGNTALDGLMKFNMNDGGFSHIISDVESNSMASAQALCALCAVYRQRAGLKNIYDFSDVGNGNIIDIFSKKNISSGFRFSDSDVTEFNSLPKELTGEHYSTVARLFEKLKNSENKDKYKDIYAKLEDMYSQISKIRSEVESINNEIAENLYPFDKIDSSDKEIVNRLVKRTGKLSEYDRSQVLGYEDLIRAKAKVDSLGRKFIVFVIISLIAFILVMMVLIKYKKRRLKKADVENKDW